jgi:hypothetical protein
MAEEELSFTQTSYVFTYGKHEGESIEDVPNTYLEWSVNNIEEDFIVEYCEDELARRNRTGEYIMDEFELERNFGRY